MTERSPSPTGAGPSPLKGPTLERSEIMTAHPQPEEAQTSLTQDLSRAARYYLGGKRGLIALAALAIVGGLVFNWSWLVAAGIAPVLLSILPCAAMCALGLCMRGGAGNSCSTKDETGAVEPAADTQRHAGKKPPISTPES